MNDEEKKTCVSVGVFLFLCLVVFFFTNFADVCTVAFLRYENSREILASLNTIKRRKNHKRYSKMKVELFDFHAHQVRTLMCMGRYTYKAGGIQKVQFVIFKHSCFNILSLMGQIT